MNISSYLKSLGLPLLPVAPAFPASEYPRRDDPTKPMFSGKNPSYLAGHRPIIVDHKLYATTLPTPYSLRKWFRNPRVGYGTKPGFKVGDRYFLAIDIDQKNFETAQDCDDCLAELLNRCPALAQTRIERTQSGGYHLWVWAKEKPGFVKWCMAPDESSRGEILGGKDESAFMVIAPTDGYELISDGDPVEIEDWGFIFPHAKKRGITPIEESDRRPPVAGLPDLAEFFGPTARAFYEGPVPSDRSDGLTTILNEAQGWINWLNAQGIAYNGSLLDIAAHMARAWECEEKVQRVLKTIDSEATPACVFRGGDDAAWLRVRKVAPEQWREKRPSNVVAFSRRVAATHDDLKRNLDAIDSVLAGEGAVSETAPKQYNAITQLMDAVAEKFPDLWWNEFSQTPTFDSLPNPIDIEPGQLRIKLATEDGIKSNKEDLADVVVYLARQNPKNPIVEYLKECHAKHGNQSDFLNSIATRYFGTGGISDTFMKKTLIAAVARACDPGCKQETITVLQDPRQGVGKSDFWRLLTPNGYFDSSLRFDTNRKYEDTVMQFHRFWITEWGEIDAVFRKREASFIKGFLSTQVDTIRRPYMRNPVDLPRPSIFVGTTNQQEFLSDSTGDRRYWVIPVQAERIPVERLEEERDILWAAAYAEYQKWASRGKPREDCAYWLTPSEERDAEAVAQEFSRIDPWQDAIAYFTSGQSEITVSEILDRCLKIELSRQSGLDASRVADCLRRMGWKSRRVSRHGKRPTVWFPPTPTDHPDHPAITRSAPPPDRVQSPAPTELQPPRSPDHPQITKNFPKNISSPESPNGGEKDFQQNLGDRVITKSERETEKEFERDQGGGGGPLIMGDRGDQLCAGDYVQCQVDVLRFNATLVCRLSGGWRVRPHSPKMLQPLGIMRPDSTIDILDISVIGRLEHPN